MSVNIHTAENADKLARLQSLPDSCAASADELEKVRKVFEEKEVFSPQMIDGIMAKLRSYGDADLRARLEGKSDELAEVVHRYWHCG